MIGLKKEIPVLLIGLKNKKGIPVLMIGLKMSQVLRRQRIHRPDRAAVPAALPLHLLFTSRRVGRQCAAILRLSGQLCCVYGACGAAWQDYGWVSL